MSQIYNVPWCWSRILKYLSKVRISFDYITWKIRCDGCKLEQNIFINKLWIRVKKKVNRLKSETWCAATTQSENLNHLFFICLQSFISEQSITRGRCNYLLSLHCSAPPAVNLNQEVSSQVTSRERLWFFSNNFLHFISSGWRWSKLI